MSWFKVDDKLWGHPKWMAVPARARGLWVTAGSWSASTGTDGRIPSDALRTLGGTKADASALVRAGLWRELKTGWTFHEWTIYQPDAASEKAKKKADSDAGILGNHRRWHSKRGLVVPDCPYCNGVDENEPPLSPEDEESYRPPDRVPDRAPDAFSIGSASPVPVPDPLLGLSMSGGLPKQRASSFAPQACGESHDPKKSCGACAKARRDAKTADADAERDMNRRQRESDEKSRADREAEAARTLAELEADPDAPKRGLAQARAALKAAKATDGDTT